MFEPISDEIRQNLKKELHKSGLDLMLDERAIMIEKIINIIVVNFSTLLTEKMNMDYHKMAEIFSKTKGITIEHFIIIHKIEKIKELIIYDELNLTEISYKMHYSSVAHLSKQFKQITGLTPTFFKALSIRNRNNLEDLIN